MKRIYEPLAYGDRPIRDRFWDQTVPDARPVYPQVQGEIRAEYAVIGGGYTGLSAALRLAGAGAEVVLLDAQSPGWGASGRNGGLVSAGSAKLDDASVVKRFGTDDAQLFFDAERASVELVEAYLDRFALDVDRHSRGYTYLAHSPRAVEDVKAYGAQYMTRYGLPCTFVPGEDLADHGLASPEFHAAVHVPLGFALNPMKFVLGLTRAAEAAGVRMHSNSPVTSIGAAGGFLLRTPQGQVRAGKLLIATNGYGSDDIPPALAGRYLPVQSNILVTRPLSEAEIAAQGWTSRQMLVDTRKLLHYFRLMPDNRVLFGLRGSVRASETELERTKIRARADFDRIFPAWRHVESTHFWSGLICMTRDLLPFAGQLGDNIWAGFAYHGGGVAMAPYAGALIADLALGRSPERKGAMPHPALMQRRLRPFELGPLRRWSLPPAFAWYRLADRL